MSWDSPFIDLLPIRLPDGRKLETLADCRAYILALPAREQEALHWQYATEALLTAAEHGGLFLMIARISVSRALQGIVGVDPAPPAAVKKQDRWKDQRRLRP